MTITVTLQMKVKEARYEGLEQFLQANLPNVRGFSGALNVSVYYNAEQRDLMLSEEWLSKEHHQSYIQLISENGVMSQLLSFMQDPPAITYYERAML